MQWPFTQGPSAQLTEHLPQFRGSVSVSTQMPSQQVLPGWQQMLPHASHPAGQVQMPSLQSMPPVQGVSQSPQFSRSVFVSTQMPLQHFLLRSQQVLPQVASPDGQTHLPSSQTLIPAQAVLQSPQCLSSVLRFRQTPSQHVSPVAHGGLPQDPQ